ncbi:hypothetical protein BGP75_16330 [Motiliproteus sp. MSK22-1]|nr:hypothetical protein BGP75_16330 [Motiliproteus sp. MSK22-1]
MAPGLQTKEAWRDWLLHPERIDSPLGKVSLKQIPPLLRRRFSPLGKCAMGAILPILEDGESIPSIFASRHGDTELSLSLQKDMGLDEPMSPTGFSLAVHNAVSGLFSIARKDTSEITSISAMEALVLQALLEAVGQLQVSARVLCVVYDMPLPEPFSRFTKGDQFPYAIAMILSQTTGDSYSIEQCGNINDIIEPPSVSKPINSELKQINSEPLRFLQLLTDISSATDSQLNGASWRIAKVK